LQEDRRRRRRRRRSRIRSMLCALVMFLGFIIAPTSAYPTGKVVEVTEADFDAQVRPEASLLPRGRG
jgi:hypothetical protein